MALCAAKYRRTTSLGSRKLSHELQSVRTKHVSSDESGSDTGVSATFSLSLHASMKRRVLAMVQSFPPRQQVSEEDSTKSENLEDTKSPVGIHEEEPEVDHPKGNEQMCIDPSCKAQALIGVDCASGVGSAVFGNVKAASASSSSISSSTSSSSASSTTSRSRSTRGKSSVPAPPSDEV